MGKTHKDRKGFDKDTRIKRVETKKNKKRSSAEDDFYELMEDTDDFIDFYEDFDEDFDKQPNKYFN